MYFFGFLTVSGVKTTGSFRAFQLPACVLRPEGRIRGLKGPPTKSRGPESLLTSSKKILPFKIFKKFKKTNCRGLSSLGCGLASVPPGRIWRAPPGATILHLRGESMIRMKFLFSEIWPGRAPRPHHLPYGPHPLSSHR